LCPVQLSKVRFVCVAAFPSAGEKGSAPTRRMSNARAKHLSGKHTLDAK